MALSAKLYLAESATERRAASRRSVRHGTTLRLSGLPIDVLLHDLSETGALIETTAPMPDGATVTIGLAGVGRFEARLISRTGSRYGCCFASPLTAAEAAAAFGSDAVVVGSFTSDTGMVPEGFVRGGLKWPGAVRVGLPTGIALGGWVMMIQFARRVFGW